MKCPGCASTMKEEDYEGVPLDFCASCGGVWASSEELGHVALTQKKEFPGDAVLSALRSDWGARSKGRELRCPACADPMEEFDYLGLGVKLDRCAIDHGVFFDKLELEKIQNLVERGTLGMEKGPAAPAAGPKKCPHCGIVLDAGNYEGVQIDACGACGGVWTETGELGLIIEKREKAFSASEKAAAEATALPARSEESVPRVLCPVCKDLMERLVYACDTGIVIDKCAHGIWLDKGELERIQAYVEGSSDLEEGDRRKWGEVLRRTGENILRRRETAIAEMKWSRFALVNKMLRHITDRVME